MKTRNQTLKLPDNWNQMSEMDRRSFLEWSLKLAGMMAMAPILEPAIASAQTAGNRPTRFVNFFIRGGSCQLSSYLSPTATSSSLSSLPSHWKTPGLATSFRPSTASKATEENVDFSTSQAYGTPSQGSQPIFHARTSVGPWQMPLLWSSMIPVGEGTGVASMKSLIQSNCALIYGLESAPAHPIAETMLLDPEPGAFTVGGYISAMAGAGFFPAIADSRGIRPFKTLSGSGLRVFNPFDTTGGQATDLLRAVNPMTDEVSQNSGRRAWFQQMRAKMLQSVESMRLNNMISRPGISELYHLLGQAQNSVDSNLYAHVLTDFTSTLAKYRNILARAKNMATNSIQGISDPATVAANPVIARSILRNFEGPNSGRQSISNVASLFTGGGQLSVHDSFACTFAMAEVALRNNLTRVLQLGFGEGMVSMRYVMSGNTQTEWDALFDNHERGVVANLIATSAFYYIFNTMLYELRRNIQGITSSPGTLTNSPTAALPRLNDLINGSSSATPAPPPPSPWRDTVILVNTEFQRNPDSHGGGSQHGYHGSSAALFSGRISGGLKVFGRTTYGTQANQYGSYPGAWGRASVQMNTSSGRPVSFKDLGATLAGLFGANHQHHHDLTTLLQRSERFLQLDSNGDIVLNGTVVQPYQLVNS